MRHLSLLLLALPAALAAQETDSVPPMPGCNACPGWNVARAPFRVHGNTHYVGTEGLSALLVTSPAGHVLVDAGLPESAPRIMASIRALGFRVEDVRVIVNSHAHYDHAGGIAMLQRASKARVVAHPWSAAVMRTGVTIAGDPQYGSPGTYPGVARVDTIADGDTIRVGPIALVAHFTGGHTPGGTTWSWQSCEAGKCATVAYADSQTPVSADGFRFTGHEATTLFRRGHAALEAMPCDLLVTPHPSASRLFERAAAGTLIETGACRAYAATARRALEARLEREKQ